MGVIITIFSIFFAIRLVTLAFSVVNEKRLRKKGAVQYGRLNSVLLTLLHITFYFSSLFEAYQTSVDFNVISAIGLGLMTFGYLVLFVVIYTLRDIWTLKIYILPNHRLENGWLFRTFRHPNYFLSIIPELVGFALLCNAWFTLLFLGHIYMLVLFVRIRQEERAMKSIYR